MINKIKLKINNLTPQKLKLITEKIGKVVGIIFVVVFIAQLGLMIWSGSKPIVLQNFKKSITQKDIRNVTIADSYKINNKTYYVITFTNKDGELYSSKYGYNNVIPHTSSISDTQVVTNDANANNSIVQMQLINYLKDKKDNFKLNSLKVINNKTIRINNKKYILNIKNTQIQDIIINNKKIFLDKNYSPLLSQQGQKQILKKENFSNSNIIFNGIAQNNGISIIYFSYDSSQYVISTHYDQTVSMHKMDSK